MMLEFDDIDPTKFGQLIAAALNWVNCWGCDRDRFGSSY